MGKRYDLILREARSAFVRFAYGNIETRKASSSPGEGERLEPFYLREFVDERPFQIGTREVAHKRLGEASLRDPSLTNFQSRGPD